MPPCGDLQQDTVTDVVITLGAWIRSHPEWVLGTNEAGMRLQGATRAADAAIWRRADLGGYRGGLRRVPPVLAVEVAGEDESEGSLREKARWYLDVGVVVVWLVFPDTHEVLMITRAGEQCFAAGTTLPAQLELPDLQPSVDELFTQISNE